jgi:hypothetical protein
MPLDPEDDRLWDVIARGGGDRKKLQAVLEACTSEELITLAALALEARHAVRAPWEGPVVPGLENPLSEDGTENLTEAIVSAGRARWQAARGADDATLGIEFGRKRKAVAVGPLIYVVYQQRFGDDYFDALEARIAAEE